MSGKSVICQNIDQRVVLFVCFMKQNITPSLPSIENTFTISVYKKIKDPYTLILVSISPPHPQPFHIFQRIQFKPDSYKSLVDFEKSQ